MMEKRDFFQKLPLLVWGGILFLSLWRFYLAAMLPLTPDESYYSLWAMTLQGGYYDHPYMVALWIKIGVFLSSFLGYSEPIPFFIRFLGPLSALIGSILFYDTALSFFKDHLIALLSVAFLNITIFYGAVIVIMTPDVPQIFFVIMVLWSLSHLFKREGCYLWASVLGLSLGLGGAAKYTMILLVPGLVGVFLFDKRNFWKQKEIYLVPLGALLPILPVLLWNREHDWVGLLKQGNRIIEWHSARALGFLSELFAGQVALITPLLFILSFYGLWRIRKEYSFFLWLLLPSLCIFIFHAFGDRVQANWLSLLYPPLMLVAAWIGAQYRNWSIYAIGMGSVFLTLLSLQSLGKGISLSAHYDPIARQMVGWKEFSQKLQENAKTKGVTSFYIEDYALASILCLQEGWHYPIISNDMRWRYLGFSQIVKEKKVFSVAEKRSSLVKQGDILLSRMEGHYPLRSYLLKEEEEKEAFYVPFCGEKAK